MSPFEWLAVVCAIISVACVIWVTLILRKRDRNKVSNTFSTPDGPVGYGKSSSILDEKYLLDFRNWRDGGMVVDANPTVMLHSSEGKGTEETEVKKIPVTPLEMLQELERKPDPFSMQNLDEKLMILKEKQKLVNQLYAQRDVANLIERLELRKKYIEFASFFEKFDNTTDESVNKFCTKHDFVLRESDLFTPEFPDDAIKVMKEYTEQVVALGGKQPKFFVIATADSFREAYARRDPILLVQSPFGFYWQILGAWDKEMLIVYEL